MLVSVRCGVDTYKQTRLILSTSIQMLILTLPSLVSEHLYADTTLQCPPINFSTNTSTCQLSLADNAAWLRPHSVPTASACATGHSLIQLLIWKEHLGGCIQLYSVHFKVCRLFPCYLYSALFYMYTIHFKGSGRAVMVVISREEVYTFTLFCPIFVPIKFTPNPHNEKGKHCPLRLVHNECIM